jgi:cell division protein FtsQ
MKKLILKLLIVMIVIPAAVIGTIHWLNQRGFFNLEQIEIAIDMHGGDASPQFLQPLVADLNQRLEKYRGQSLWQLNLPEISKLIRSLSWIETNAISRSWPTRLNVKVHPKSVKLLYLSKSGEIFPVVEDGSLLQPVTSKTAPDVTLLEGPIFENNMAMRKKAVKVIEEVPGEGKFSHRKISELRYDPKEGFWATLIQTGIKVKMGEENIPLKAARVSQVLEYLETRELEARVIDANLSKKVLVRLRKDP